MKKYLALIIVSIIFICISSNVTSRPLPLQTPPIQGTWQLVLMNGEPVTNIKHIKNYTDTHFSWEIADLDNNIQLAVSGPYEINKNIVTETLEFTPKDYPYKGTKAITEVEVRNDTLFITGKMNSDGITWT